MIGTRRDTGYALDVSSQTTNQSDDSDSDYLANGLLILKAPAVGKQALWSLWHRRLGHLNMQDVKKLALMTDGIDP